MSCACSEGNAQATWPYNLTDMTAATPSESDDQRASRVLMDALAARRDRLDGAAGLGEAEVRAVSGRILGEARRRSEQISAKSAVSARLPGRGPGIPAWLVVAWMVALGLVVTLWWML